VARRVLVNGPQRLVRAVNEFGSEVSRLLSERGMSLRQAARLAHYDASYLSRVISGSKTPSLALATALDEALGSGGALTALAGGGLDPDDAARLTWAARNPRHVDQAAADSLAAVLAAQRRTEDVLGSAAVLPAVRAQARAVDELLTEAHGVVRPAVVDIAAQWAQFAGWLALNTGDTGRADARFSQAIELAAEIGDDTMIAAVLSFRGYAAWRRGNPGPVVGLAQAAQRPGIALSQRAYGAGLEARGLAMTGDADGAERKADEMLERAGELPGNPAELKPAWLYWYTPGFFACQRGLILGYFAYLPRFHRLAADALTGGYEALPPDGQCSEWGGGYLVHLAAAHARAGDVGEACAAAMRAAAVARQLGSKHLSGQLSRLRSAMTRRWPADARVAELADALR